MTKLPVGLQLYSVRDAMAEDFAGTLKKVKEMGYDAVEFAGLYGHSAAEVKALCDELGLDPVSAHVGLNVVMADLEGVVKMYHEIGCKFMVIPWGNEKTDLPGAPNYDKFLSDIRTVAAEMRKYGMKLCYHNHDFEFKMIDGKYKLDILYSDTTPEELQTQVDTCWARVGGEDPAQYVKKYTGRAPIVHIKDYNGGKSAQMYGLIDGGEAEAGEDAGTPFELRPVGYGVQDVVAIFEAAESAGAGVVIVEQDEPSLGKTPMECAKMSIDYIRSL